MLPLDNTTLSLEGPNILRVRLRRVVSRFGYDVQPLGETDVALRRIGINLGGQVPLAHWEALRDALGTDAVVTGRVLRHSNVVTGVVNASTIEAEMAMTDLRTGQILWYSRRTVKRTSDIGDAAGDAGDARVGAAVCLVAGVVNLIAGAAQHDLRAESEELAGLLCRGLPPPGQGAPRARPAAVAAAGGASSTPLADEPQPESSAQRRRPPLPAPAIPPAAQAVAPSGAAPGEGTSRAETSPAGSEPARGGKPPAAADRSASNHETTGATEEVQP